MTGVVKRGPLLRQVGGPGTSVPRKDRLRLIPAENEAAVVLTVYENVGLPLTYCTGMTVVEGELTRLPAEPELNPSNVTNPK